MFRIQKICGTREYNVRTVPGTTIYRNSGFSRSSRLSQSDGLKVWRMNPKPHTTTHTQTTKPHNNIIRITTTAQNHISSLCTADSAPLSRYFRVSLWNSNPCDTIVDIYCKFRGQGTRTTPYVSTFYWHYSLGCKNHLSSILILYRPNPSMLLKAFSVFVRTSNNNK